jgi:hypothetical protein
MNEDWNLLSMLAIPMTAALEQRPKLRSALFLITAATMGAGSFECPFVDRLPN